MEMLVEVLLSGKENDSKLDRRKERTERGGWLTWDRVMRVMQRYGGMVWVVIGRKRVRRRKVGGADMGLEGKLRCTHLKSNHYLSGDREQRCGAEGYE